MHIGGEIRPGAERAERKTGEELQCVATVHA
jgi:hypothetical protein